MTFRDPKILMTLRRSDLMIPLGCTAIAQYAQDIYASHGDPAALAQQGLRSPFLLFSVLKVLSLTTLIFYAARPLSGPAHMWRRGGDLRKAESYLACVLAANVALAGLVVGAIGMTQAESVVTLFGVPITRSVVKVALVLLILSIMVPLNRRLFRDISIVIGRGVDSGDALLLSSATNRLFGRSLVRNFLVYVAPPFALHVLIVKLMLGIPGLTASMALADSLLVGLLGLMAGHAILHVARGGAGEDGLELQQRPHLRSRRGDGLAGHGFLLPSRGQSTSL